MTNANEVLEMVNQINEEIKPGDQVEFAKGHELAGVTAKVIQIESDGSVTVLVGRAAIRQSVPMDKLVKISYAPGVGDPK